MLIPETTQAAVMFLISVGSLAASELKERWILRRKQAEVEIDFSQDDTDEVGVSNTVTEILSNKSYVDVNRILDLVLRKRKLIYDAQREKLNAEEEYNEGRITLNMLQLRKEKSDQQIKEKLAEIEVDLRGLGLDIVKSKT